MCMPKILRCLDMNFKKKKSVTKDSLEDRKKKIKDEVARIATRTNIHAPNILADIIKNSYLRKDRK